MNLYIIAGEKSGDLHAANLLEALRSKIPSLKVRAWGGERLLAQGAELVHHYKETSFMGFFEVVKNLKTIKGFLKECKQDLLIFKPDLLILVDYPGFNLRIAEFAKKNGIPVVYYISPKIWAWNTSRVHKIKKNIDLMLCIFPFEKEFYARYEYPVSYVGNPLFDELKRYSNTNTFKERHHLSENKPLVALLPGSRKQELKNMLPILSQLPSKYPEVEWAVSALPHLPIELYQPAKDAGLPLIFEETYDLLKASDAAIVTSGTATLETALLGTLQVVGYKTSFLTALIAKMVIQVPYISLVNLVANEEVVPELLQYDFTPEKILAKLKPLLDPSSPETIKMRQGYSTVIQRLETVGASELAADEIVNFARQKAIL